MNTYSHVCYEAICYADIFDYPLTLLEIQANCIHKKNKKEKNIVGVETKKIRNSTYHFLSGRSSIVHTRLQRKKYSGEKWRKIYRVANVIRHVPTVCLIGVTGGLSMNNAKRNDDIDVYCVTEKGALWVTRLFVTLVTMLIGVRRKPKDTVYRDKICLNMFATVDGMGIPRSERDLFSAHEVVQMVPIWEKRGTYKQFLSVNRWVYTFLPSAKRNERKISAVVNDSGFYAIYSVVCIRLMRCVESIAHLLQRYYMSDKITTEIINSTMLRFHPHDARIWIKKELQKRLENVNIPLDTVFYRK